MSDKMRWRYGDTNPVVAAVNPETVIEIGDLLWQDADNAKPASVILEGPRAEFFDARVSLRVSEQENFACKFLGVAMNRSRKGDTDTVRVATTGVFEFNHICPNGTFELGDLVGARAAPAMRDIRIDILMNQAVVKVTDSKYAIARVAKREPSPVASVLIDVRSTVMTGGILARP